MCIQCTAPLSRPPFCSYCVSPLSVSPDVFLSVSSPQFSLSISPSTLTTFCIYLYLCISPSVYPPLSTLFVALPLCLPLSLPASHLLSLPLCHCPTCIFYSSITHCLPTSILPLSLYFLYATVYPLYVFPALCLSIHAFPSVSSA